MEIADGGDVAKPLSRLASCAANSRGSRCTLIGISCLPAGAKCLALPPLAGWRITLGCSMCGICGIVDFSSNSRFDGASVAAMCSKMRHRGPDDEGVYAQREGIFCGLGHRRLSIIDLSAAGHQPMSNEDGSAWLVFNGEIYNYKVLKDELKSKGHIFKSESDTETVVHLYEEYGDGCVEHLRGMFAFALWDKKARRLLLARDRVGKKPLLYWQKGNTFCFASEFDSLLSSGLIEKRISYQAMDRYLTYGYIPAPLTIYENVFKLPPAHSLVLRENRLVTRQYWQLDYGNKVKISEDDAASEVLRLLKEAVSIRLYSDVPLGLFLSGGIDSSAVAALMSRLTDKKVKTFSIGFEDADYSELKYARNIARKFGTEHHEFIVKPDALGILPLLVERYGEPYADSSCIPTYYVAEQTKKFVTVALNGDGGDESFAGYERYQAMLFSDCLRRLPYLARLGIKSLSKLLPDSIDSKSPLRRARRFIEAAFLPPAQRYKRWVGIFSDPLKEELYSPGFSRNPGINGSPDIIDRLLGGSGHGNPLDSLLNTDVLTYLPDDLLVKVDIAGMANSLEARSPFLDHKLMEFAASLPAEYKLKGGDKKHVLKKAIKGLVPDENVCRRKMGFGVPVGKWFRGELKDFLKTHLLSPESLKRGYFNPGTVKGMVERHIEGRAEYTYQLWALLMLELWQRRFID